MWPFTNKKRKKMEELCLPAKTIWICTSIQIWTKTLCCFIQKVKHNALKKNSYSKETHYKLSKNSLTKTKLTINVLLCLFQKCLPTRRNVYEIKQ